jgi:hypothetical protein
MRSAFRQLGRVKTTVYRGSEYTEKIQIPFDSETFSPDSGQRSSLTWRSVFRIETRDFRLSGQGFRAPAREPLLEDPSVSESHGERRLDGH